MELKTLDEQAFKMIVSFAHAGFCLCDSAKTSGSVVSK